MVPDFTRDVPAVMLTQNADDSGLISCSEFEPSCCCLIGDQCDYKREMYSESDLHFLNFFMGGMKRKNNLV